MKDYLVRLFLVCDQLVGVLLWKGHDPDETISSRLGRKIRDGRKLNWFQRLLNKFLNWIDPNHCVDAIEHGGVHSSDSWPGEKRETRK